MSTDDRYDPRVRRSRMMILPLAALVLVLAACDGLTGNSQAQDLPDFELVSYGDNSVLGEGETSFSAVMDMGKPVVLNFWAGQCPPCRAEMPAFQRVADEHPDEVIIVGIDVGVFTGLGSHDAGRQLLDELDIRFPTGYAVDSSPLVEYEVRAMPTTIFIKPNGEIQDRVDGMILEPQLRDKIQKLIS